MSGQASRLMIALIFMARVAWFGAPPAAAQQAARPLPQVVQPTALEQPAGADARPVVTLGRRAARVGDEVEQSVVLEMRLKTMLRRGNEITERSESSARTEQQRIVRTTAVHEGRSIAASVRYVEAAKQIGGSASGEKAGQAAREPQPVHGRTYLCRREPGSEKLIVTDSEGRIPSLEEFEVVAHAMDSIGRPNPLAEYLAGRSIRLGETLTLPNEVAARMFGLGDTFGQVVRFELRLDEVQPTGAQSHAVFHADLEAASSDASQMRMQVEGRVVVETATCRAVHIELAGPIAMSESRGTYSTAYQMLGTGRISVNVASKHRDAR